LQKTAGISLSRLQPERTGVVFCLFFSLSPVSQKGNERRREGREGLSGCCFWFVLMLHAGVLKKRDALIFSLSFADRRTSNMVFVRALLAFALLGLALGQECALGNAVVIVNATSGFTFSLAFNGFTFQPCGGNSACVRQLPCNIADLTAAPTCIALSNCRSTTTGNPPVCKAIRPCGEFTTTRTTTTRTTRTTTTRTTTTRTTTTRTTTTRTTTTPLLCDGNNAVQILRNQPTGVRYVKIDNGIGERLDRCDVNTTCFTRQTCVAGFRQPDCFNVVSCASNARDSPCIQLLPCGSSTTTTTRTTTTRTTTVKTTTVRTTVTTPAPCANSFSLKPGPATGGFKFPRVREGVSLLPCTTGVSDACFVTTPCKSDSAKLACVRMVPCVSTDQGCLTATPCA
jgi:hypothetical protein